MKNRENKAGRVNWVQKPETGKTLEDYQRILRKYATPWEKRFKKELYRWCAIQETQFVFQKIFWTGGEGYIVDFYLPEFRIVFELDGKHHLKGEQLEKDRIRDEWFRLQSIRVVRAQNREVDGIGSREIIEAAIKGRPRKRKKIRVVTAQKKLVKQCKKEMVDGIEITICPEITDKMLDKDGNVRVCKSRKERVGKKKYRCRKETPGTFKGSVIWKG